MLIRLRGWRIECRGLKAGPDHPIAPMRRIAGAKGARLWPSGERRRREPKASCGADAGNRPGQTHAISEGYEHFPGTPSVFPAASRGGAVVLCLCEGGRGQDRPETPTEMGGTAEVPGCCPGTLGGRIHALPASPLARRRIFPRSASPEARPPARVSRGGACRRTGAARSSPGHSRPCDPVGGVVCPGTVPLPVADRRMAPGLEGRSGVPKGRPHIRRGADRMGSPRDGDGPYAPSQPSQEIGPWAG
ncbi:hypothetical protein XINFAN_03652 [Pseudogemmobacter humi]|uniref:Uncharacterized protein n=1 Tax=Pseudogemmobacter humi TaxID=2483812 RepID=A0A3P5XYC4_9RHOB|nr:hypothetical protein XINFAN_03652 [Pseudogemmobacter humi]